MDTEPRLYTWGVVGLKEKLQQKRQDDKSIVKALPFSPEYKIISQMAPVPARWGLLFIEGQTSNASTVLIWQDASGLESCPPSRLETQRVERGAIWALSGVRLIPKRVPANSGTPSFT